MNQIMLITKALSDSNRIRALMALRKGELCVCELIDLLSLAASTVSKHLSILHHATLIIGHKRGKWMYYSLNRESLVVQPLLIWLEENLKNDPVITSDLSKIKGVVCSD